MSIDNEYPCVACGRKVPNTSSIEVVRHRAPDYRRENLGIPQKRNNRVTEGKQGTTFLVDNVCDDCVVAVRNYFELVWEAKRNGR